MMIRYFLILLSFSLSAFAQEKLEGTIYFGIEDDMEGKEMREFVDLKTPRQEKSQSLLLRTEKFPRELPNFAPATK